MQQEGLAHWRISGRVQGVGFRWFVVRAARRFGVRGEVRNLADGSVEIWARAPEAQLAELFEVVRQGPPRSSVERVERLPPDPRLAFEGFEIRD